MPAENSTIKFVNEHKQDAAPFVIYADFETLTEKVVACQPADNQSFTQEYQNHRCFSIGYKLVCKIDGRFTKEVKIYRGKVAIEKALNCIKMEAKNCNNIIKTQLQHKNINIKKLKIPVIFHNLRGYDGHIFCNRIL